MEINQNHSNSKVTTSFSRREKQGEGFTFTIITATFNAAHTLERTLQSVAQQTFRNVEHIIMDGGSTDSTLAIAKAYQQQNSDLTVTIVSERDKGLYDALNKGIRMAKGRYLIFLNAGDKFHANYTLQKVAERIKYNPDGKFPAVVYGETDIVDDAGMFLRHRRLQAPETLKWTSFRQGMLVCHQSFYALREITPEYDLTYRFSADFDWCVRIMKKAKEMGMPFLNTHSILTDYLAEGLTTQNHKESLRERFRIMAKHYGWLSTCLMHLWFIIRNYIQK